MDKSIETLRTFFTVSCAAFDMQRTILKAFNPDRINFAPSSMESLHRIALTEVMKDIPNIEYVDYLLNQMELLAEHNSKKVD